MGEKVRGAKNEGEKKAADVGKKVNVGSPTLVFMTDMYCEENVKKIKRAVKHRKSNTLMVLGVEQVKTDVGANKLPVTGKVTVTEEVTVTRKVTVTEEVTVTRKVTVPRKVDPAARKVDLVSSQPDDKPKESSVTLKTHLCCDNCNKNMRSNILKFKGVSTVSLDTAKDLVTVMGTMDIKALGTYLSENLKRSFDVIAPAKAGAKKDDKKAAARGGEKKDGGGDKNERKEREKEGSCPRRRGHHGHQSASSLSVKEGQVTGRRDRAGAGAGAKKDDKKAAAGGGENKDGGGDKKKEKKGGKKEAAAGGEKKDGGGEKKY